jgi:pyrroloquinoline quinone biosynthesis protein B
MQVKILGSAAGGGFPQWNCSCANCFRLRQGTFSGTARTQTQLAFSCDPDQWTLVNASPDLRFQIEALGELWPRDGRRSPISGVIVTSAEVDQILGLLLLREFHRFDIYSTSAIRSVLTEDNSLFRVLARFERQVRWCDVPFDSPFFVAGARVEALPVPGSFPGYVARSRAASLNSVGANIGLLLSSQSGGKTLAFLPGVGCISDPLIERLQSCDILLFDGTFWSDDEPVRIPGLGRTALQIGHLPISGRDGSLEHLATLTRARKIYIHINNTNPMLDEESDKYREVRERGWEVAHDGMEFVL